jgi:hypothetical protein
MIEGMRNPAVGMLLVLLSASAPVSAAESFGRLSVQEVAKKRVEKNVFVFDNNEEGRFKRSHVAGAKWVNPYELKPTDLPTDKSATLIFYCANEH